MADPDLTDPRHPVNVMYRQHLEYVRGGGTEGKRARLGLGPVRADAVVPRSRQDLRDHYTAILEGKIVRNLSVYPVTKEEKERYLRDRLAEWEATPTAEIRFGDMTGAILGELLRDLEDKEPSAAQLREKFLGSEKARSTRYNRLAVQLDPELDEEGYRAALAALNAVPGVSVSHYILTDSRGTAHLKMMDVSKSGRITAVQG